MTMLPSSFAARCADLALPEGGGEPLSSAGFDGFRKAGSKAVLGSSPAIGFASRVKLRQRRGLDRGDRRNNAQVIVLDANILLYAYDASSELHGKARAWIEMIFSSGVLIDCRSWKAIHSPRGS